DLACAVELMNRPAPAPAPAVEHFGEGPLPQEPARPGPEPLRLWLYGAGLLGGLLAFGGAVVMLNRRSEQSAPAPGEPMTGQGRPWP
ncbi:serine protease, partial [Streptosporangium canum]